MALENRATAPTQPASVGELRFRSGTVVEEGRRLYLVKVLPDGTEVKTLDLPEEALSELSEWFDKFREGDMPDGEYRIYLWERGLRRLLIEFFKSKDTIGEPPREPGRGSNPIENGQSYIPRSEGATPTIATQESTSDVEVAVDDQQPISPPALLPDADAATTEQLVPVTSAETGRTSHQVHDSDSSPDKVSQQTDTGAQLRNGAAAVAVAGVVTGYATWGQWKKTIDKVMEESEESSFRKIARLCRRLGRQIRG